MEFGPNLSNSRRWFWSSVACVCMWKPKQGIARWHAHLKTSTPESEGAYTIRHMLLSDYKDAGGTCSQYQKCEVVKVRLGSSHWDMTVILEHIIQSSWECVHFVGNNSLVDTDAKCWSKCSVVSFNCHNIEICEMQVNCADKCNWKLCSQMRSSLVDFKYIDNVGDAWRG